MKVHHWCGSLLFLIVAWVAVACGGGGGPEVTPAVLSVEVAPATDVIAVGEELPLTATVEVTGGASRAVTWASSDDAVATVDADGVVTGVAPGTVDITATSTVAADKSAAAVITVEQVVSVDDVASLREAVADAPVGAVIELQAGEYELSETLQIALDRDLRGSPGTVLRLADATDVATVDAAPWSDYGRPVLYAEGVTLQLSDVELEYVGEAGATVVVLIDVDADLRNVQVRGGAWAEGSPAAGHGIYARDGNVDLDGVTSSGNAGAGLISAGSTQLTVAGGTFRENTVGIDTLDDAVGWVEGASLLENGWVGAFARGASRLTLVDVNAVENSDHGALALDEATLVVAGGRFAENGFQGLTIGGDATATITEPTVERNGGFGVLFDDRAQATMANADVTDNGGSGIEVAGASAVVLEDNRAVGNGYAGIAVVGTATATGRGNEASGNVGPGLFLVGGTATFEDNEIIGNATGGGAGLLVLGTASAVLSGNEIGEHAATGVAVLQNATADVTDNVVRDNGGFGIEFRGDAGGNVDGNVFRANGNCGIYPGDAGNVVIGDNTFEGNAGADVCTPVVVTITLTPTDAVLQAGQATSFSAAVSGSDDARVVWGASCGVVEGSGATIDYRAPVTGEDSCTLTATSLASPGASAVAEIEVTPIEIVIDTMTFTPAHPATLVVGGRVRVDWSWTSNIVGPYQVCAFVESAWTGCIPQDEPNGSATSELWRTAAGTVDEVRFIFQQVSAPFWRLDVQPQPVSYEWREQPLELFGYVGTYSRPGTDLVTNLSLALRGPPRGADETVSVTVTGPEAWGTYEHSVPWRAGQRTTGTFRWPIWRAPVSGTYEVTATVDGEPLSSTVTVDADLVLPRPTGETLITSAIDELALSWDPVPGAAFFEVQFNEEDDNLYYVSRSTVPAADYSRHDLDLDPTARHFLRIIAISIDLQPAFFRNEAPPPVQQVNTTVSELVCFYPGDAAFSDCE